MLDCEKTTRVMSHYHPTYKDAYVPSGASPRDDGTRTACVRGVRGNLLKMKSTKSTRIKTEQW